MSDAFVGVHLRDVEGDKVVAAIDERMGRQGYERVDAPSWKEPVIVRALVVEQGRWTSMTVDELDAPDRWACALSKTLRCYTLGSFHWDGESTTSLVLFDRGEKIGELEVPRDARRIDRRKLALPLGKLSCLVGDGTRRDGLEVRIPLEQDLDEDTSGRVSYVSRADIERVVQRTFGIETLNLEVDDDEGGGRLLSYRPKPSSAAGKRAREEEAKVVVERRAAYDARLYAVGWLAFDAKPSAIARLLAATARPLVEAFAPHLGPHALEAWSVAPAADHRREKTAPPESGDRAWEQYAALLREGVMIDLRRDDRVLASVCAAYHEGALALSWSFRGLKDEARRRAIATTIDDTVLRAVDDSRCFGALVSAQSTPLVLEQRALAYEYYRQRSAVALLPSWFRTHTRSPGWRVLVPAASATLGDPPPGFIARRVKSGTLLLSNDGEPWAVSPASMDALEAYLAPSLGAPAR